MLEACGGGVLGWSYLVPSDWPNRIKNELIGEDGRLALTLETLNDDLKRP